MVFIFVGITGNAYKVETQAAVQQGESFTIKDYTLIYDSLATYPTANKEVSAATVSVFKSGSKITVLTPEKNFHRGHSQPASEVAIYSNFKEDVYVVLAGIEEDLVTFKVLVTPLVIWLWIGGGVMAVGTLFAMLPNMKKRPQPVRQFSREDALEGI